MGTSVCMSAPGSSAASVGSAIQEGQPQKLAPGAPAAGDAKGETKADSAFRGRKFQPHRWDEKARGFIPCSPDEPIGVLPKKELDIISYNIWFGSLRMPQRMRAIGNIIKARNPDLVALQEVTKDINAQLMAQEWTRSYYVSDPEGKLLNRYGQS